MFIASVTSCTCAMALASNDFARSNYEEARIVNVKVVAQRHCTGTIMHTLFGQVAQCRDLMDQSHGTKCCRPRCDVRLLTVRAIRINMNTTYCMGSFVCVLDAQNALTLRHHPTKYIVYCDLRKTIETAMLLPSNESDPGGH